MAVTIQSTTTQAWTSTGADGTKAITKPSGLAEGDLMIGIFTLAGAAGGTTTITEPAGWTNEQEGAVVLGNDQMRTSFDWKYATAGDVAASDFSWTTGGGGGGEYTAVIYRIDGMPSTGAIEGTDTTSTPSITVTQDGELVVFIGMQRSGVNTTNFSDYTINGTNPTWTETFDTESQYRSGEYARVGIAYATQATATDITSLSSTPTADEYIVGAVIPIVDAAGTIPLVDDGGTVFSLTGKCGVNANIPLVEDGGSVPEVGGSAPQPTRWVNESKSTDVWDNETKL